MNVFLCGFYIINVLALDTIIAQTEKPKTVGNVQALGANGKAAFSPKAHGFPPDETVGNVQALGANQITAFSLKPHG